MEKDDDETGWSYEGWTGDPAFCSWCRPDGPCNYGCIIPDPADEQRREQKEMGNGQP